MGRGRVGGADIGVINDLQPTVRIWPRPDVADEDQPPPSDAPVLYLQGGDWLSGNPAEAGQPGKLGWQAPSFTRPFAFDLSALARIRFPAIFTPGWREHDYRLELAGGDVLYGELLSVSDTDLHFRSSLAGEVRVKRSALRSLEHCKANPLVYLGPNGLAEWQTSAGAWREEEGQLASDKDGALLYQPIELPARALVEFEVSSLSVPTFRLSLGVTDGAAIRREGLRLEVVDTDVIAVYETASDIDVARVMTLKAGPEGGRVHLRVLLDQQRQRADVYSAEGLPLASVQVKSDDPPERGGVCLEHTRGGLRLERLRVWNWSGPGSADEGGPNSLAVGRPQLQRIDGTTIEGTLAGYDAAGRRFRMATGDGEVSSSADEVARIYFGESAAVEQRPLRVAGSDGTLVGGRFLHIDREHLALDCPVIDTPTRDGLSLPVAALAGISFSPLPADETANRALLMRLRGGRMHGRLAASRAESGQSAVCWQPAGAAAAVPLRDDASARIDSQPLGRSGMAGRGGAPRATADAKLLRRFWLNELQQATASANAEGKRPVIGCDTLYLSRGDIFRCEILSIDEAGIHCRAASAEKRIAHAEIKAADLAESTDGTARARLTFADLAQQREAARLAAPNTNSGKPGGAYIGLATLDREKFVRLLTLPRLDRDDPPTHLLCAANGDCLRGRLTGMSQGVLRFAAGKSEREFLRERIAAIVWLHPPGGNENLEVDGRAEHARPSERRPAAGEAERRIAGANRAHAVGTDGTCLTFSITEIDGEVIAGVSPVLGDCQLPLDQMSELLLGDHVRQAGNQTAYHDWTLTPAPDPKAFQTGDEQTDRGLDSPLVGQPAPDFELDTIDGGKFRLSQRLGRTVVLDFWASWCAPCVKGLPRLAEAVNEFEAGQVELVAINLRESPGEARAALARMGLDLSAALDRDGAVAGRYGASSIPHTVVVGPDGRVVRVFVGTRPETAKQLKAAIEQSRAKAP